MAARVRGLFLLAFWFTLIAVLAPFMILLTLITGNENMIYSPVRFFVRVGLALVGVRVEVKGLKLIDPKQTYIFTPNHQSFIEVPLLVTFLKRNIAYLAKKELFKYPIWKQGIKLIGVVPVNRSNTQAAVESARLATEKLRSGKSYAIYPEGTRSRDGRLLPFKKGAFMMAIDAGVPIVPVSISGSTKIMPKGEIKIFPSTVRITVHEPISTKGYSKENISELMSRTRAKVISALSEEEIGESEFTKNTKAERIESASQH
ncbi:MAG TPA: lysophospholipid acyltransferase family protein [Blastocatellia bacterium]|nr:lysophospholipid acyltransferase family protein [Blastocatellia bacterium]